jgi:mRNA interferase RelE/StbE
MRKLDYTANVLKFLGGLQAKQFRQVVSKILSLPKDPEPNDSQKLQGYPYRRAEIGEYRIVYRYDAECVYVAFVGKRNDDDIYKQLKR